MKLFSTLSDVHKERALHMAEHLVLNSLLENGIEGEAETTEEREHIEQVQKSITYAKTLETPAEQAEYLFKDASTGELIMDQAYQVASSAMYIEEDETIFHIKDIDAHYEDENLDDSDLEEEKEFAEMVAETPKKDTKHLN